MQTKDIKVGEQYGAHLYGRWGKYSNPFKNAEKVTVVSSVKNGEVTVKNHPGRGNAAYERTIKIRDVVGTWAEVSAYHAQIEEQKNEAIAEQKTLDARLVNILGRKTMKDNLINTFEVENDGSYSTNAVYGHMSRSTLVEIVEAAYEAGRAD